MMLATKPQARFYVKRAQMERVGMGRLAYKQAAD